MTSCVRTEVNAIAIGIDRSPRKAALAKFALTHSSVLSDSPIHLGINNAIDFNDFPSHKLRAGHPRYATVPRVRGEDPPARFRGVSTLATGLSGHRLFGVRHEDRGTHESSSVRHVRNRRGCGRETQVNDIAACVAQQGEIKRGNYSNARNFIFQSERREWIKDNGRQRNAVPNFRHAEFASRRDGGTRIRHDYGSDVRLRSRLSCSTRVPPLKEICLSLKARRFNTIEERFSFAIESVFVLPFSRFRCTALRSLNAR